jgi:hypothetical protein
MTPPPAVGPGPELERLSAALAAWRKPFAAMLAVIGLACLGVSGYCFNKAIKIAPADETAEKAPDPLDPTGKSAVGLNTNKREFYLGGIAAAVGALIGLGSGGYLLGRLPPVAGESGAAARQVEAFAGGALGLLLMLVGLGLLVLWFGTLVEWVTKRASPDAWKVITGLLVFLVGGGLAFVSTQLLRMEERNNQTLRRIAFGTNTALSILLLLVALVAANVIVGLKLPARLDTTSTGFYTLHPETTTLLQSLPVPVTVYTTVSEDVASSEDDRRLALDLQRLLEQCRAANPSKFSYRVLSPLLNKADISKLQAEHAEFKRTDLGVLMVTEGKPGRFVPEAELSEFNRQTEKQTFLAEPKLVSLMLSLTEDDDQTVYFLQGHGEIGVGPRNPDDPAAPRTASRATTALEKLGSTVKPLTFELTNPKVPDDAAVVVIADPRSAIPPEHLAALRTYLNVPRTNKKKGKLLVLTGPHPNPDGKGVVDTGLGGFLAEYGVLLGNEYVYFSPTQSLDPTETDLAPVSVEGANVNPVTVQFARRVPVFVNCREVSLDRQRPGGEYLFASNPGRVTWLEPDPVADPMPTLEAMTSGEAAKANAVARQKKAKQGARLLAVAATDGGVGRVVVYGSGDAFADPPQGQARKLAVNPELLAATVNWLRDRPTASNITGKEVAEFKPNRSLDGYKGLLLPVVGTMIAVVALGLGVWVYRRK